MKNPTERSTPAGPISMATVITPSLTESLALYTEGLGWEVRSTGPEALARWVDKPDGFSGDAVEVGPTPGAAVDSGVRLVEVPGSIPIEPLRTIGWSALEVSVLDVEAATQRAEAAGWRVLYRPVALGGGKFPLVAAQLAGRSGEGMYLTQILGELDGFELPNTQVDVDGIFICVLGSSDLEENRALIEDATGGHRVSDRELPVRVVNAQYNFPMDTLHRISSVHLNGRTCIEVDQLPEQAVLREDSSEVPAGIRSVDVLDHTVTEPQAIRLQGDAYVNIIPKNTNKS